MRRSSIKTEAPRFIARLSVAQTHGADGRDVSGQLTGKGMERCCCGLIY
jgi:hypothetical protein